MKAQTFPSFPEGQLSLNKKSHTKDSYIVFAFY